MKKLAAILVLGAALASGAAFADTIQNGYGNTFVVTSTSGQVARYHFNEDGTFTGVAPGGSTMAGRYTAADGQLCLIPPNGAAPMCTAIEADKNVGDSWTQLGTDGSEITVTLEAGRP
jgi:hypothetical protein